MSLPKQIASILATEIRAQYKPDSMIPPQRELAERFGVSVLTVREAVQCLMQEGLLERRHGSGTYVLAQPAPEKWVAVLMENDIGQAHISYAHRRTFQQVRQMVAEAGFPTRGYLGFLPGGEPGGELTCGEFLHDLRAGRIAALVSVAAKLPEGVRQDLRQRGIPFLGGGAAIGFEDAGPPLPSNVAQLVQIGARHLIDCGRKRLAMVLWAGSMRSSAAPTQEERAFRAEIERAGLTFNPEWVRADLHPQWVGAGWEEFREIWRGAEKPDGVLITDDVLAQDVTIAIHELGIQVPEQLMVVTHATRGSGVWSPFPVAKVEYDPEAQAQLFSALIINRLRGEPFPSEPIHWDYNLIPMPVKAGKQSVFGAEFKQGAMESQMAGASDFVGSIN